MAESLVFDVHGGGERWGRLAGFAIGYLLFTTALFAVLTLSERRPTGWTFLHVAGITFVVTGVGTILRRVLA